MPRKLLLLAIVIIGLVALWGCPESSSEPDDTDEPEEVFYDPDIDNSFMETLTEDDTVEVSSIMAGGVAVSSGDTVEERYIEIEGSIPDFSALRAAGYSPTAETERMSLAADGGSCMSPGPWNDTDTFTIDFQQTVSVSYDHRGVMCTGDWGFDIYIKDATSGNVMWSRVVDQGLAADVDQTTGSLDLPPGTYSIDVSTYTGTDTYVNLTYTPGTGGVVGSNIVVYQNGNLYPVSEAEAGATYSHVVDLNNGSNTVRVLVIGNFDPAAVQDLENIFAASEPFDIFCMSEDMAIRAVMSWQLDDSDVDLHLVEPGGTYFVRPGDCYYGNLNPNWGDSASTLDDPVLDHDNTSGYGPETITLPQPQDGIYTLIIHYYSDHGSGDAPTTVNVTLNESNSRSFGPRTLTDEEVWIVTGIDVDGGTASFTAAPDSSSLMPAALSRIAMDK